MALDKQNTHRLENEDEREKACLQKLTWKSEDEAWGAIVYAGMQHSLEGKPKAYQCKYCQNWHLSGGM